jgi:hypothetical protein
MRAALRHHRKKRLNSEEEQDINPQSSMRDRNNRPRLLLFIDLVTV